MLHTKFRGNRSDGSGVDYRLRVFTIYENGGHLGHETSIISTHFHFMYYLKAYKQNLVKNALVVSEKSMF